MSGIIILCGALCSTIGTLAVKQSCNFRRVFPAVLAITGYGGATWFLARAMNHMPVAFAHAAWSGLVALFLLAVDRIYFKVPFVPQQIFGFFCILSGIAALSLSR